MGTIKLSVSKGDKNVVVEGEPEVAWKQLVRLTQMYLDAPGDGTLEEVPEAETETVSFPDFYSKSNPKRGTHGLIAAKYLTDVMQYTEIRIPDFKAVLEEVGESPLSMPARANLVGKGWLNRAGRGRYELTDLGRAAYDKLVSGASLRELPVAEVKRQKGKRGGILSKYNHPTKPTNIIACLINEKGPIDAPNIAKLYDKHFGPPPANLKLLLNNMTNTKIGTAKLSKDKYTLTDKGANLVKGMKGS